VVDPSLLRLAADRGVTVCFADLDGADGLWVPEERTILVSRRLPECDQAEVIEHELGHVSIDDGHAVLDAGVGRAPSLTRQSRTRTRTAALSAAACVALLGGVVAGLAARTPPGQVRPDPVVAPTAPPLTGPDLGGQNAPAPGVLLPSVDRNGRTVIVTVTLTPTPARAPAPTRSATGSAPARTPSKLSSSTAHPPIAPDPVPTTTALTTTLPPIPPDPSSSATPSPTLAGPGVIDSR